MSRRPIRRRLTLIAAVLLLAVALVIVLGIPGAPGLDLEHVHAPGRDAERARGGVEPDSRDRGRSLVAVDVLDALHLDVRHASLLRVF